MTDWTAERAREYRRAEANAKTPEQLSDLARRRCRLEALGEWPVQAEASAPMPAPVALLSPAPRAPLVVVRVKTPVLTYRQKMHKIAAGSGAPANLAEDAIAAETPVADFALAMAERAQVERLAAEIVAA